MPIKSASGASAKKNDPAKMSEPDAGSEIGAACAPI
jgi:hypothetical protein